LGFGPLGLRNDLSSACRFKAAPYCSESSFGFGPSQPPAAEAFEPPFEKFEAPPAVEQDGGREMEQLKRDRILDDRDRSKDS
jgi:hypothetical protein